MDYLKIGMVALILVAGDVVAREGEDKHVWLRKQGFVVDPKDPDRSWLRKVKLKTVCKMFDINIKDIRKPPGQNPLEETGVIDVKGIRLVIFSSTENGAVLNPLDNPDAVCDVRALVLKKKDAPK